MSDETKNRTSHPPLYCEVCTSRIIITVPESSDEYALECECDTVAWTDQWPNQWGESATAELI